MALGILTFLSALTISAVAIYYSVAGLAAIFAAAVIPIIVMGVSLEVGKLVTAVWLHKNWQRATWWLKTYLSIAVVVLMFITSMGIFGFLSKAHIEQTSLSQEQVALIETLDDKETRAQAKIDRWRGELDRLMKGEDVRVDTLIEKEQLALKELYAQIKTEKDSARKDAERQIQLQNDRLTQAAERKEADIKAAKDRFEGSLGGGANYDKAVEKAKANELSVASSAQREIRNINNNLNTVLANIDSKYADDIDAINDRIQKLRNQANVKTDDIDTRIVELENFIEKEQSTIDGVREEKAVYEKEYRKLEAEVGPIKYIAEFIYGEQADQNLLEAAVRWVIIIIIFVFDPLAVLLLIASQYTFNWNREDKGGGLPPKSDPDPEPEDPKPSFTDEEWDEAHKENEEFDNKRREEARAEKIANNIPPEISAYEQSLNVDDTQLDLFDDKEEVPPLSNLDQWNEWVEAANAEAEKEAEEQKLKIIPELQEVLDKGGRTKPDFTEVIEPNKTWTQTKNPTFFAEEADSIKKAKKKLIKVDPTEYFDKEGFEQVKKTYTQNEEQTEGTLWNRVKRPLDE